MYIKMPKQDKKVIRYKVIKRNIKYSRLEVKDGLVYVILPKYLTIDHKTLFKKYSNWINKKLNVFNEIKKISENLSLFNHENFKELVLEMIEQYSNLLKEKPTSVSFRWMKRRWGSCQSSNRIIFNKFLKFLPKKLIEYVVIHEMCHLKIKNHKKEFWLLVKKFCPDFAEREKLLAAYKIKLKLSKAYLQKYAH